MPQRTPEEWAVEKAKRETEAEGKICPFSNTNCYASECQMWGDYFAQCEVRSLINVLQKWVRSNTASRQEY